MTITIKFNDNVQHYYGSFKEILKLDNYNDIIYINCNNNNLSSLPELPNSITFINYCHNPIYIYIYKYFNDNYIEYNEYQKKMKKVFAIKIGDWFLECRYNPKYKYCRKRLMKEYEECYGASPYIRRTMI